MFSKKCINIEIPFSDQDMRMVVGEAAHAAEVASEVSRCWFGEDPCCHFFRPKTVACV